MLLHERDTTIYIYTYIITCMYVYMYYTYMYVYMYTYICTYIYTYRERRAVDRRIEWCTEQERKKEWRFLQELQHL